MAGVEVSEDIVREGDTAKVDEDTAEFRVPRKALRPYTPTKADIEEHFPLHLNYRSWCPHCVSGRGLSTQHRSVAGPVEDVTWHMDYCFLGDKAEDSMLDDIDGDQTGKLAILVTYDELKHAFWALQVERKGPAESVVKWCYDKLEDSGYGGTPVTIKSDQEESIVALRRSIAAKRIGETIPINSPVRCSKSNGRMERAIRTYQGQLRTLKIYFEDNVKKQLPSGCAMFSWLIAWTSEIINKFKVQEDGKTAYESITKHKCNHMVIGFGESVQWQMTPNKNVRDKVNGDFRDGIFLGVIWRTTEYLIGTPEGIF